MEQADGRWAPLQDMSLLFPSRGPAVDCPSHTGFALVWRSGILDKGGPILNVFAASGLDAA
ncbi:hypothetical protein LY78DRAFT_660927 [Colletotrichum sublineola]|nr:hypothetical protein LY78DRAFT_660927 [Colletotrichum sublineola]